MQTPVISQGNTLYKILGKQYLQLSCQLSRVIQSSRVNSGIPIPIRLFVSAQKQVNDTNLNVP